jgi:hypothetical protein
MAAAEDNGQVFVPYDKLPSDFSLDASAQLRDGSILAASFLLDSSPAPNRFAVKMARSTDVAGSWTTYNAPLIENKWKLSWYRIHRDLMELPDGTLLLGGYGQGTIDGVNKQYSLILQSTDRGKSWSQRSAVNAGSPYGTNELGFTRTSDGRLIAVMRGVDLKSNQLPVPLTQTFSDNDGISWEPLKQYVPPAGLPNDGVMPEPMLQPNGQLLMTYGRPDNNVVVSHDGTGRTWDDGEVLYSRYPGDDFNRRWMGSSGNMALVNRDASSALAFGDNCHNIWFCREYGHDNQIWTRIVDARGPGVGKIDLTTKVADGTVKLSAQGLTTPDSRFPEQRPEGAVDGSGGYRAAARFAGDGKLTIELDKPYQPSRIGLMMSRGETDSAVIQTSLDGTSWGKPVATTGIRTDYAMHYQDINPTTARFVRITPGDGAPLRAVTELELDATNLMTFENDAVTTIPRNLKDTRYALVADKGTVAGYDHSRARLALQDNDQTARAQATIPNPTPAATQHYNFGYEGYGYGSGAIWEILGTNASGEEVVGDRLLFAPDSANNRHVVKQWDGNAWQVIGYAGPFVPNKSWMNIDLYSDANGTTIAKDGVVMGTSNHRLNAVTEFTGLRVETGQNPQDVGNMEHSYDDIAFGTQPPVAVSAVAVAPDALTPGRAATATATITNTAVGTATRLQAELTVPDGWTVSGGALPSQLAGGASATITWKVTAPVGTAPGAYPIGLRAGYQVGTEYVSAQPVAEKAYVGLIPQGRMTATASTYQGGGTYNFFPMNAIDGDPSTIWHSQYTPTKDAPPQSITLDLHATYAVSGLIYEPRHDSYANGIITAYNIYVSTDGTTFTKVSTGTWASDGSTKSAAFPAVAGVRAVRLEATAAVADYVSAAEINVLGHS